MSDTAIHIAHSEWTHAWSPMGGALVTPYPPAPRPADPPPHLWSAPPGPPGPACAAVPSVARGPGVGATGPPPTQSPGPPLQSVVNASVPVIRIDASSYYALQNGVWFVATSPAGPWAVATSVPSVIYTIPVSSPLHYVTYAYVYGTTPDVVYTGYTPGYLGTVVAPGPVVVYGTGYVYPDWVGTVWYPAP